MSEDNTTGNFAEESKPVYLGEDGEFYNPLVDSISRANTNMDLNHHEIHEGEHNYIAEYITLESGAVGDFIFEVGNEDIHFVFSAWSDIAGFTIQTYEDVEASENGTLYTLLNNCRPLRDKDCGCVLRYNPTVASLTGKLRLRNTKVGQGGAPSSRVGGSVTRGDEVILERNMKYLLRITNLSTSNNDINLTMSYYHKNVRREEV